jgi:hypothetical protein
MKKSALINFFIILSILFAVSILKVKNAEHYLPDVLFHGSPNSNISVLDPYAKKIRTPNDPPFIFASPYIGFASCFLFPWDGSWTLFSYTKGQARMVIGDKEKFHQVDQGGTIYLLPTNSFEFNKNRTFAEWTSESKVVPYYKIKFSSALEAMELFGVKVYFFTPDQFQTYRSLSTKEQDSFINELSLLNPA